MIFFCARKINTEIYIEKQACKNSSQNTEKEELIRRTSSNLY